MHSLFSGVQKSVNTLIQKVQLSENEKNDQNLSNSTLSTEVDSDQMENIPQEQGTDEIQNTRLYEEARINPTLIARMWSAGSIKLYPLDHRYFRKIFVIRKNDNGNDTKPSGEIFLICSWKCKNDI